MLTRALRGASHEALTTVTTESGREPLCSQSRPGCTVGARPLPYFAALHGQVTLLAGVLPALNALQPASVAGCTQETPLCRRPPLSWVRHRCLLHEHRLDVLVTEASGVVGDVGEHVLAAQGLSLTPPGGASPAAVEVLIVATPAVAARRCQAVVPLLPTPEELS